MGRAAWCMEEGRHQTGAFSKRSYLAAGKVHLRQANIIYTGDAVTLNFEF